MVRWLTFFARFYTPGKFILFLRTAGHKIHFLPKLLAAYYCMQDKDTPNYVRLVLMGAIGYAILPFDFLPDTILGFGWVDDAAVLAAAWRFAGTYIKPEHREKVKRLIPFAKV
ncbi:MULTISPECIES: YkvA family protein [Megasphaera]|uniref:PF06803 family protein n=1 Tax=Megasphaera vaginalis (ex Srinivasan et al. 2021) TaxID=1111454 RepID=U7UST3_9FIRM|nr:MULTISPECIES: DUF1232 domain-containing protein [Megasphaera]ERT61954.1 PF06803 family protein [Megasphaera vaginalis (ex Srinivasan et al. 2021)]